MHKEIAKKYNISHFFFINFIIILHMFQRFLPKIITQKLSNKEKEDTIKVSNVISAIVVFESDNRAVISYSEAHIKSLQKILADPD